MVKSKATTVAEYLAELPDDRRAAIERVRAVVKKNLPKGYEESIQWSLIGWSIPLARYATTHNKLPLGAVHLGAQKGFMAIYLPTYMDAALDAELRAGFKAAGKKLDMGKACLRFKRIDDLALDVIAKTLAQLSVERMIDIYERGRAPAMTKAKPKATPSASRTALSKARPRARARAGSPSSRSR